PRKDKPAVLGSITLMDIVANGTDIRIFKETVVVFGETSRKRIVMNVRRHSVKAFQDRSIFGDALKIVPGNMLNSFKIDVP
ncbi:hypothetical protein Q6327_28895, partial [Klebsiella pneumoniae]|nr:hypothetical protein [Klebsiella pneumoniae]